MNIKRITALAAAALISSAVPAMAANPTATVTVKWNTQTLASLAIAQNYSAAGAAQTTAPAIFTNANAGSGTCTAAGAGSEAAATVNYGNVTPDAVKYTDCNYNNAINATYSTNDSLGYSLTIQETTAAAHDANKLLCYLPNGAQNSATVVQSTRTSNALTPSIVAVTQTDATCSAAVAGAVAIKSASTSTITSAAGATAGTLNAGADYELVLQPNAPTGADSAVATYTLVLN